MCYFLYGSINEGINTDDYQKATKDSKYRFVFVDIKAINECVKNCDRSYRITLNYCDCDTAVGQKRTNKKELEELKDLFLNLQNIRGIKYVLLSKNWWKETNEKQETVHIQDIDI